MHDNMRKQFHIAAADTPNIDGAGAVAEFVFAQPVKVRKVGIIVTTAVDTDNSVALTATLSRRPIVGSSANEVDLGVFTMAPAANTTELPAGAVKYKDLAIADHDGETAEDGSTRHVAPNAGVVGPVDGLDGFLILPGQSFVMTLDTNAEADSGAVRGFVEVVEMGWSEILLGDNVKRDTTDD